MLEFTQAYSAGKYINGVMSVSDDKKGPPTLMEFFKNLVEDKDSFNELKKMGIGISALIITCFVFMVAANDPKAMTDQFYLYIVFGLLPVVIGVMIASNLFSGELDSSKLAFYGATMFVFIISMYMFYRILNPDTVSTVSYFLVGLSALVFIVGLAIVYRIFIRTILNARGWVGLLLKSLFLIPCLLIETMETVFAELKEAPKMVVVLFILELIIILAYLYFPRIAKPSSDSIVLLNAPVFLTSVTTIGKAKQLVMDVNERDNPSKEPDTIRQNYSISMWFYVNQHPNTYAAYSKETNIFRYGYPSSKNGHPRVAYFNDRNDPNKSDKYIVYVNDSAKTPGILLDIPTQSWNQLVISYNESNIDIYVNGNLEKTVSLKTDARPNYDIGDILEVGEGDNTVMKGGLHGAICNVVYYKNPLKPNQVATDYNLNRYKNPPVNY